MGTAIKGQTASLAVGTAPGAAITATGATNAKPCVVTATNTLTVGAIIVASGFVGMTGLNNRAFVASPVTGSAITLKGIDAANTGVYGTYSSGGSLLPQTMTQIGNVKSIKGLDGQAQEVDTTDLQSTGKQFFMGLQDGGQVTFTAFQVASDAGQVFLRKCLEEQAIAAFSLTLSDGTVAAFMAFVKGLTFDGVEPDGVVTCDVTLRVSGAPSRFA